MSKLPTIQTMIKYTLISVTGTVFTWKWADYMDESIRKRDERIDNDPNEKLRRIQRGLQM